MNDPWSRMADRVDRDVGVDGREELIEQICAAVHISDRIHSNACTRACLTLLTRRSERPPHPIDPPLNRDVRSRIGLLFTSTSSGKKRVTRWRGPPRIPK